MNIRDTVTLPSGLVVPASAASGTPGATKFLGDSGAGTGIVTWQNLPAVFSLTPVAKAAMYQAGASEYVIVTSGSAPIVLPAHAAGKVVAIRNAGSGLVGVIPVSGLINGPGCFPQANQVTNPGAETNTTGWGTGNTFWTATGATLSRSTTVFRSGVGSLQVVTTAVANEGTNTPVTARAGVPLGAVAWMRGNAGGEGLRLGLGDGTVGSSNFDLTATTGFQLYATYFTPTVAGATAVNLTHPAASVSTYFGDDVFSAEIPMLAAAAGVVLFSDGTDWHVIHGEFDTGWQNLVVGAGWAGSSLQYRKIGPIVYTRGVLNTLGTTNTTAITYPATARPGVQHSAPLAVVNATTQNAFINISTAGVGTVSYGAGPTTLFLSSIPPFYAEN